MPSFGGGGAWAGAEMAFNASSLPITMVSFLNTYVGCYQQLTTTAQRLWPIFGRHRRIGPGYPGFGGGRAQAPRRRVYSKTW